MEITVKGSEFILFMGHCSHGGPFERKIEHEIIIVPSHVSSLHDEDISTFFVQKIINCTVSILYPKIRGSALGTETKVDITILNHPTEISLNDYQLVGIDRLWNRSRGRSSLHGIVKTNNCITNEKSEFLAFDMEIKFFMQGIRVGSARYQIYRSSQYSLRG